MFQIDNTAKECMDFNIYFNRVHVKNAYHWSNDISFIEKKRNEGFRQGFNQTVNKFLDVKKISNN